MIRAGWGVAYEGAGAVYGDWSKEIYLVAEAEAQCVSFLFLLFSVSVCD
jgi:hypothetical protein